MRLSLLEMTQNILSAMDSDEVNTINDTVESRQVAQLIRTVYFNIFSRANLPEHNQLFQLTASGDADLPVLMTRPENVARVDWIKYDMDLEGSDPLFQYVTILPNQQFLDQMHQMDSTETEVDTMDFNDLTFYFRNDRPPTFCTTFQDSYVVFDAYNSDLEATLQTSNTMCYGLVIPTFSLESAFTPEIDENQFPLLLNEAKSLAFQELKQVPHQAAASESRRQWISLQKNKNLHQPSHFDQLPYFGRI